MSGVGFSTPVLKLSKYYLNRTVIVGMDEISPCSFRKERID